MQPILDDFRIESDSVVCLTFANGKSYRVNPNDLERYLSGEDVAKIRQAIRLRSQFMRRILPPTAMVLLLAGIIALGSHDMQRVNALIHPRATVPEHRVPVKPSQSAPNAHHAPAASTQPATTAPAAGATNGSMAPTSSKAAGAASSIGRSAATTYSSPGGSRASSTSRPQASTPILSPVTKTVDKVTQPVTKTVGGILHALP